MKKLIAALCLVSVPAMAETPCNYDHNVETQFTKSIDKSEVIDRKVFPYVDDTRKCVMSMMITIDGKEYPGSGDFVFGPDMSENAACSQAEQRAKLEVVRVVSPEVLNAKTDMNCSLKQEEPKVVEKQLDQLTHPATPLPKAEVTKKTIVVNNSPTIIVEPVQTIRRVEPIQTSPRSSGFNLPDINFGGLKVTFGSSGCQACGYNY